MKDGILYKLNLFCVLEGKRVQSIQKVHSSHIVGHFGVGKT